MNYSSIRTTLKAGSMVFGASALFLLVAPTLFLDLLGLDSNVPMVWSMRMIAITLVALAGNMWNNSKNS